MKRKKRTKSRADELLVELLGECKIAEDILGRDGLIKQLTKRALEMADIRQYFPRKTDRAD